MPAAEGHGVLALAHGDGASAKLGLGSRAWAVDGEAYSANSRLVQLAPSGELSREYVQGCAGAPANYNQLGRELRVEASSPRASALTSASVVEKYAGGIELSSPGAARWDDDVLTKADHFVGGTVSRWHRESNKLEHVYNLFEFFAPTTCAGRRARKRARARARASPPPSSSPPEKCSEPP